MPFVKGQLEAQVVRSHRHPPRPLHSQGCAGACHVWQCLGARCKDGSGLGRRRRRKCRFQRAMEPLGDGQCRELQRRHPRRAFQWRYHIHRSYCPRRHGELAPTLQHALPTRPTGIPAPAKEDFNRESAQADLLPRPASTPALAPKAITYLHSDWPLIGKRLLLQVR